MASVVTWRKKLLRIAALVLALLLVVLGAAAWMARGPFVLHAPRVDTIPADPKRLEASVRHLAENCVPRNYRAPEKLELAAAHVEAAFREMGDAPELQPYTLREGTFRNILVRRPGSDPSLGLVIVGAHYDAYMRTPGADDNASGVAVMLELARLTRDAPHRRTQVFIAFSTEEPPFFSTPDMGSARFAQSLRAAGERVHLMVALDLVGMFCDEPGCQPYPFTGMELFYPSRGNFIAVTGDMDSSRSLALVKRGIAAADVIPVVSFRAPRALGYTTLSDHSAFWDAGYPAVLVTNTAMLRNSHYHGDGDLPDTLDYERMARVVQGLQGVLVLADAGADAENH